MKLLLFLLFIGAVISVPLNPKKVTYAIDCGASSSHKGVSGVLFERDVQTDPDTVVADYTLNHEVASQVIKFTREPEIYLSERHAYKSFSYRIPLQRSGTYVLIMKFAEMYFKEPNKRVFNIKFGESKVVDKLDVVAKVGRYAAYDEYIEFEYTLGKVFFKVKDLQNLNNEGVPCLDAVVDNKLIVTLEKTQFDNPYVHGIVLFSGTLEETDFNDIPNLRANWDKIHAQEQRRREEERQKRTETKVKRKEKVKVRNDNINELEYQDFETDDTDSVKTNTKPRITLKKLITGPIGVVGLWVALIAGIFATQKVCERVNAEAANLGSKPKKQQILVEEIPEKKDKQVKKPTQQNKQKSK